MAVEFQLKFRHMVADMFNVMRALTGVGSLGIPFAVEETGWLLAGFLIAFISVATCYASEKLIESKYLAIDRICDNIQEKCKAKTGKKAIESKMLRLRESLSQHISLHQIGQLAIGRVAGAIYEFCCLITLFGISINYYILFGNSLYHLVFTGDEAVSIDNATSTKNATDMRAEDSNDNLLILFVLIPLPLYMCFALFREFRHFSIISCCTSVAIIISMVVSTIYVSMDFSLEDVKSFAWSTLVVGFMQMLTAFEILPLVPYLESSMRSNHHNFQCYMRGVVSFFATLTFCFGLIGYLRYGNDVPQMIPLRFERGAMSIIIDCSMMVAAVCAYALPMNPVNTFAENLILRKAKPGELLPKSDPKSQEEPSFESSTTIGIHPLWLIFSIKMADEKNVHTARKTGDNLDECTISFLFRNMLFV
ncbi:hypothetical protein CAPTEDRAFT_212680 [Capitella teleta]|uniref:Amino acid transporter transmembrane domain-containing protein n=1 Tax=Capitella teleta TaxID=283909 RepID=R7TKA5_CAPTE|nr:hypothetical protein CAPTEDRAFT_212680 [Capitella teleta]|eukprot:ELT94243.1 hypothetical protein CAPTEDRAFT_212680 [Capitella teleta]